VKSAPSSPVLLIAIKTLLLETATGSESSGVPGATDQRLNLKLGMNSAAANAAE